jgi:phosphoribosylanthranilate isomerase
MEEEDAVARGRGHDRARGEVAFHDPPVEGLRLRRHERADPGEVRRLLVVGGVVARERAGEIVEHRAIVGRVEATPRPRFKVCCIRSHDEAWMAIHHGASALGLVSAMPSGPGVISEDAIAEIAAAVPPGVATFLLTSLSDAAKVSAQQRRVRTTTVQICDRLLAGTHADLRAALPGIGIVQVVHVTGAASVDEAVAVAPRVDALLLDSGNPALPVKELGGTGRRHDWALSRRIREAVPVPVFLAGGLRAENAAEGLAAVAPFALDVCSGVRTDGALDERKLERFAAAIEAAGMTR